MSSSGWPGPFAGVEGGTLRLTAQVGFEDGLTRAMSKLVDWSSSDPDVVAIGSPATCDPVGLVRLLAPGTATISATYPKGGGPGSLTTEVEIRVDPVPVGSASRAFLDAPATLLD